MTMFKQFLLACFLLPAVLWPGFAEVALEEPVLTPTLRAVPGVTEPVTRVSYRNPAAEKVNVAGTWDRWHGRYPLSRENGLWIWDAEVLALPFGRYEFKFVVDGTWETGENRLIYANKDGQLHRPPDVLESATLEEPDRIMVRFKNRMTPGPDWDFRLDPPVPVRRFAPLHAGEAHRGYRVEEDLVTFVFDESVYGITLTSNDQVAVAGNFNDWQAGAEHWMWRLNPDTGTVRRLAVSASALKPPPGEDDLQFKFVINDNQWLSPPPGADNAVPDGRGHTNLRIDPDDPGIDGVTVITEQPLILTNSYVLLADGLAEETAWAPVTTGTDLLDRWVSDQPLGAMIDHGADQTLFRLFAPRATDVSLHLYDGAAYQRTTKAGVPDPIDPTAQFPMVRDSSSGVWETTVPGLRPGAYYSFRVDGPTGPGEGFDPLTQVADPYARAVAHARNNAILVEPEATNRWFAGWTDEDFEIPAPEDLVIYETHVRDLSSQPSSGVPAGLRGTFAGVLATEGTGAGLDHLRDLGINAIELLPVAEFDNGTNDFNWGYASAFFFAPDASYGSEPLEGSQYYEFKHLVNELHRQGFAVILDVVYNHAGYPNVFQLTDRKYFFRLNPDLGYVNFSGCGNDFRSEAPMMRRLIIDNVLYWMKEHHVDGFRFDLAELIDMETLMALHDAARTVNPDVILISEPWSFRGNHKQQLTGTGWAAWNDDFRNVVKAFVKEGADRDQLKVALAGSTESWAAVPLQSVNYLESHDDMTLADELSSAPGRDGRQLHERDMNANRLAATMLFTSLGIPMLAEGQDFLRSKHGISNSYNKGDRINGLRWDDRDRPGARETLAYYRGLIALRQSEAGRAFRVPDAPGASYYQWIEPNESQALGYIVNADRSREGARFVVLANASDAPVDFAFTLPEGRWRMVGDGDRIEPAGWADRGMQGAGRPVTITVPSMKAWIYMDGSYVDE